MIYREHYINNESCFINTIIKYLSFLDTVKHIKLKDFLLMETLDN